MIVSNSLKTLAIALLFFLMSLCWVACDSMTENLPQDRIIIQFWHGMGGPLGEVLNGLIDEYNSSQDKYYVKGVSMGSYDTLQKKILASVVAQQSPDISQNFESLTLKLSRAGKLVCLDNLIAREPDAANFKSDIIPVLLANNTFDEKLWSFPFNKSVPVLYYNKEMFREVGLDPESPPKTVKELIEYCRKLTRDIDGDGKSDIHGFAFTLRNEWNWGCRLISYGGVMYDNHTNKVYLSSTASILATKSYTDLIRQGLAKFASGYDHQNDWLAGKVAMFEASIVSRVYLKDKIKFDYGVGLVPDGDIPATILSGTNINIFNNKDQAKIDGAWDFIKWFTSTEIGARWSLNSTYLPVRTSSLNHEILQSAFRDDPNFAVPFQQLSYATFDPRIPEWFECRVKISDQLEQMYIKAADSYEKKWSDSEYEEMLKMHSERMQETVTNILENSLENLLDSSGS
jgi:multiple sugar transport system substrate-binding protein